MTHSTSKKCSNLIMSWIFCSKLFSFQIYFMHQIIEQTLKLLIISHLKCLPPIIRRLMMVVEAKKILFVVSNYFEMVKPLLKCTHLARLVFLHKECLFVLSLFLTGHNEHFFLLMTPIVEQIWTSTWKHHFLRVKFETFLWRLDNFHNFSNCICTQKKNLFFLKKRTWILIFYSCSNCDIYISTWRIQDLDSLGWS